MTYATEKKQMGQHTRWAGLLLAGILLCGCNEHNPFDKKYIPPRIKPPTQEAIRLPPRSLSFVYVPVNKRDPFRPAFLSKTILNSKKPMAAKVAVPLRRRQPQTVLEKFELDQLRVVATVTGVANPVAMVQDPKGMGHMVRRGTPMGRNGGRVQRIHTDGIVITTESRNSANQRVVSRVKLAIRIKNKKKTQGQILINGRRLRLY